MIVEVPANTVQRSKNQLYWKQNRSPEGVNDKRGLQAIKRTAPKKQDNQFFSSSESLELEFLGGPFWNHLLFSFPEHPIHSLLNKITNSIPGGDYEATRGEHLLKIMRGGKSASADNPDLWNWRQHILEAHAKFVSKSTPTSTTKRPIEEALNKSARAVEYVIREINMQD